MPVTIAFDQIKSRKEFVKKIFELASRIELSDMARARLDHFESSHYQFRESSFVRARRRISAFIHKEIEFGKLVLGVITTTQGMLLGQDETTRQIISEWRANFLIGMLKIFYEDLYPDDARHPTIDAFWISVRQLLVDSSNWQYDPEHIKHYFVQHAILSDYAGLMLYKTQLYAVQQDDMEFIQWIGGINHKKAVADFVREWQTVIAAAEVIQKKSTITLYRTNHLLVIAGLVLFALRYASLWVAQLLSLVGIAYGVLSRHYKIAPELKEKYLSIFDDNQLNQYYHYQPKDLTFQKVVQAGARFEINELYKQYQLQKIQVTDRQGIVKVVYTNIPVIHMPPSASIKKRKPSKYPDQTPAPLLAASAATPVISVTKPSDGILIQGTGTHSAAKIIVRLREEKNRPQEEVDVLDKVRSHQFNIVRAKKESGFKAAKGKAYKTVDAYRLKLFDTKPPYRVVFMRDGDGEVNIDGHPQAVPCYTMKPGPLGKK